MFFNLMLLMTAAFAVVFALAVIKGVLLSPFIIARWARARGQRKAAARERKARVRVLSPKEKGANYIGSGVVVRPHGASAHPIRSMILRAIGLIIVVGVAIRLLLR